jgi:hypothetical protein
MPDTLLQLLGIYDRWPIRGLWLKCDGGRKPLDAFGFAINSHDSAFPM